MRADEDSISKIRAEIRNELSEAVLDARCPWRVISPNFSPIEKNKAALRGIKVVSPNSYAQGEERPYGNTVYTRTNGISAVGASFSDRQI